MTTDDGYAIWLRSNPVPDFRELVQRHGGYAKIPVEAWAEFDRATAEWQERRRDAEKAARQDDDYDPGADFSRSIDEAYAAIRARVAAGGKGWKPR